MISVVYATYNEEKNLARSLESVRSWADEIVIVDGQSTDQTVAVAKKYKARVISTTNKSNFHINKQLAIDSARGDLILQLDADEVVDEQLQKFILSVPQQQFAQNDKTVAWYIRRKNLFCQTWLQKGGQYPDMVIRLFYRGQAYLPAKDVHEQMVVKGKTGVAKGHILHYANPDLATYWQKFNTYTSFKAQQLAQAQLPINWRNYIKYYWWLPRQTFWSIYLRHRGYVDGNAGFLFALFSGWHHVVAFAKYVESQKTSPDGPVRVFYPGNKIEQEQGRGVGRYTQWLVETMRESKQVQVMSKRAQAQVVHYTFFDLYKKTLKLPDKQQRLVVTVHDVIPLLYPSDYPVGVRGKMIYWGQRRRLRRAAMIVTDSQASKDDIVAKLKIKPEKIEVVYLAANPNLKRATLDEVKNLRRSYVLPKQYLLYVGDINFNKNLSQLIKALKFLPSPIQLVLVGKNFVPQDIPEWQTIQEQLALSEVTERVRFVTSVTTDRELAAMYSGALAYVQPSYHEGFGLPVLEAMRCKTPVVCGRNSSLPEVAGKWAVYAESVKGEQIAAAVEKVLAWDKQKREEWVENAYCWQQRFDWSQTANEMEQIYAKVAAEI